MSALELDKILKQAQQMQTRMAELQRELAVRRFEGEAGGGMVRAVVSGGLRVLEIRVEQGIFDSGDHEMLQDLTAAAVNNALALAQQSVQQELQRVSGGLGVTVPGASGTTS